MCNRPLALAASLLAGVLAAPSGASAQSFDPAPLQRPGSARDAIGRPPPNDLTAYGGSGSATGAADYTRELAPRDLTRVAEPLAQGRNPL